MPSPKSIYKIAIIGASSSGKSFIGKFMEKYSVSVLDVIDVISELIDMQHPDLSFRAKDLFGKEILNDRKRVCPRKIGSLIMMASPKQRAFLDKEIYGKVREEIKRFLFGSLGGNIRVVLLPPSFESGTEHLYDEIWGITVRNPDILKSRLMEQEELNEFEAEERIRAFWSCDYVPQNCKVLINNSNSREQTEQQVLNLINDLKKRCLRLGTLPY